jgi:hypothetical protein
MLLAGSVVSAPSARIPEPSAPVPAADAETRPGLRLVSEYRYRIVGKVRLVLFWAGSDEVGGARMASYSDGQTSALALLVGSDPRTAPRGLNEWGYLREEVGNGTAEVFAVRSLDEAPDDRPDGTQAFAGAAFGAVCASVRNVEVRSHATTVAAGRGVTYRMFDRLLDRLADAPRWKSRLTARPAGSAPGFLTALQRLLRLSVSERPPFGPAGRVTYFYNDTLYDLELRDVERLTPSTIGTRTFDRLWQSSFVIRNRETKSTTRLVVAFEPTGPCAFVPVQIRFQPNWWLRVELRLDDAVDVPADPAADAAMLARIREICAGAAQ